MLKANSMQITIFRNFVKFLSNQYKSAISTQPPYLESQFSLQQLAYLKQVQHNLLGVNPPTRIRTIPTFWHAEEILK